jgi:hypothetical protein
MVRGGAVRGELEDSERAVIGDDLDRESWWFRCGRV